MTHHGPSRRRRRWARVFADLLGARTMPVTPPRREPAVGTAGPHPWDYASHYATVRVADRSGQNRTRGRVVRSCEATAGSARGRGPDVDVGTTLQRGAGRCVLVGPGGVGRTRWPMPSPAHATFRSCRCRPTRSRRGPTWRAPSLLRATVRSFRERIRSRSRPPRSRVRRSAPRARRDRAPAGGGRARRAAGSCPRLGVADRHHAPIAGADAGVEHSGRRRRLATATPQVAAPGGDAGDCCTAIACWVSPNSSATATMHLAVDRTGGLALEIGLLAKRIAFTGLPDADDGMSGVPSGAGSLPTLPTLDRAMEASVAQRARPRRCTRPSAAGVWV